MSGLIFFELVRIMQILTLQVQQHITVVYEPLLRAQQLLVFEARPKAHVGQCLERLLDELGVLLELENIKVRCWVNKGGCVRSLDL